MEKRENLYGTLALQKKALRKQMMDRISGLPEEYRRLADDAIFRHVTGLLEYALADTIFCYVSRDCEVDTRPILEDAWRKGKRVGVPRCEEPGIMKVYRIDSMEDLEPGAYGILEPAAGCDLIPPEMIRLAVVPCVSCDLAGRRLGYGGGYYDRYLTQTDACRAVLCRQKAMCREIPADANDVRMDLVISETGANRPE